MIDSVGRDLYFFQLPLLFLKNLQLILLHFKVELAIILIFEHTDDLRTTVSRPQNDTF
jgi:hypothetical protein